jgi:lactoylglutathione lyase
MSIDHIAIWVQDLEIMCDFYFRYFDLIPGKKYFNPAKNFSSCFLTDKTGITRIELMHKPSLKAPAESPPEITGLAHLAFSSGSREKVDALTDRLRADKYMIAGELRTTGDGYYESIVLDPEGNRIEITI